VSVLPVRQPCATCNDDPNVCASVPGLRHCEAAQRGDEHRAGYMADRELWDMLESARHHVMTPKEIYDQKVSWITGMSGKLADPMPTREQVVKALEVMGIVDPSLCIHKPTKEKA
jgi:hypothetical protein